MPDSNYHRSQIQTALEFIEANLHEPFSVADVAQAASFSEYHFHRLFAAFMGESIHQYVRSRRLERAATVLQEQPGTRLLDLAIDIGFETHSAFSRAFKQQFNVTPSQFKKAGMSTRMRMNKSVSRPFLITKAANLPMLDFTIQSMPTMFLAYKIALGTTSGQFFIDKRPGNEFKLLIENFNKGLFMIASAFPSSPRNLNDMAAPLWYGGLYADEVQGGWSINNPLVKIQAGDWAVFSYEGPYEYLHQVWTQIYSAWLPMSPNSLRDTLPFEVYLNDPDQVPAKSLLTQIWIPIK